MLEGQITYWEYVVNNEDVIDLLVELAAEVDVDCFS